MLSSIGFSMVKFVFHKFDRFNSDCYLKDDGWQVFNLAQADHVCVTSSLLSAFARHFGTFWCERHSGFGLEALGCILTKKVSFWQSIFLISFEVLYHYTKMTPHFLSYAIRLAYFCFFWLSLKIWLTSLLFGTCKRKENSKLRIVDKWNLESWTVSFGSISLFWPISRNHLC